MVIPCRTLQTKSLLDPQLSSIALHSPKELHSLNMRFQLSYYVVLSSLGVVFRMLVVLLNPLPVVLVLLRKSCRHAYTVRNPGLAVQGLTAKRIHKTPCLAALGRNRLSLPDSLLVRFPVPTYLSPEER